MEKIKVLLSNHPQIVRDLVREMLVYQTDMEIVGDVVSPLDLLLAVKETGAHVVVLALDETKSPGVLSHLWAQCPHVTILGLSATGDRAFIEQLCPWRREIVDLSAENLMHVLREAVREPCRDLDEM
jgi:DNA-binding NarL/FixJ family response regulator